MRLKDPALLPDYDAPMWLIWEMWDEQLAEIDATLDFLRYGTSDPTQPPLLPFAKGRSRPGS